MVEIRFCLRAWRLLHRRFLSARCRRHWRAAFWPVVKEHSDRKSSTAEGVAVASGCRPAGGGWPRSVRGGCAGGHMQAISANRHVRLAVRTRLGNTPVQQQPAAAVAAVGVQLSFARLAPHMRRAIRKCGGSGSQQCVTSKCSVEGSWRTWRERRCLAAMQALSSRALLKSAATAAARQLHSIEQPIAADHVSHVTILTLCNVCETQFQAGGWQPSWPARTCWQGLCSTCCWQRRTRNTAVAVP